MTKMMNKKTLMVKKTPTANMICSDVESLLASIAMTFNKNTETDWMTVALVEGKTDVKFFRSVFDEKHVDIMDVDGKDNLLTAMDRVSSISKDLQNPKRAKHMKYVVGIMDSDFDRITGKDGSYRSVDSIIATDTHDFETMQFREEELFRVSPEDYANLKKIEENGMTLEDVWDKVFDICVKIGKVRLMSQEKNLRIPITGKVMDELTINDMLISFDKVGKKKEIRFNFKRFLEICSDLTTKRTGIDNSLEKVYEPDELEKYYEEYEDKEFDLWQICNGHDMEKVARRVFSTYVVGSRSGKDDFFEANLRRQYILSKLFLETNMYKRLARWDNGHGKTKLLKQQKEKHSSQKRRRQR